MSYLTGKCDLYDTIYMIGYTDDTISKSERFEKFKAETKGVLYQSFRVKATKFNIDMILENNHFLKKLDNGYYEYLGDIYKTLKSLNKKGVHYRRKIHFETMEDIIPYLGHIVSIMCKKDDNMYVEISKYPYPIQRYLESLEMGYDNESVINNYYNELKKEYLDV